MLPQHSCTLRLLELSHLPLGAHPVRAVPLSTKDGVKFFTADDSWLLVRFSGTEPLVRVYAEATSAALRDELLTIGEKLARG